MSTLCCHKSYNLHKSTTKNSITIKYIPFFITLNAHPTIKANKKFCFTYTLTNGLTRIISHIFLSCFLAWRQDLMAKQSHKHLQQFDCTNLIGGSLCKWFVISYSSKRKSHITNITPVVHSAFPTLVLLIQVPHFMALCTWTNYAPLTGVWQSSILYWKDCKGLSVSPSLTLGLYVWMETTEPW